MLVHPSTIDPDDREAREEAILDARAEARDAARDESPFVVVGVCIVDDADFLVGVKPGADLPF